MQEHVVRFYSVIAEELHMLIPDQGAREYNRVESRSVDLYESL